MSNTATAVATAPALTAADLNQQAQSLVAVSSVWLQVHWLQILIAFGIGAVIVALLFAARALGHRLCSRDTGGTGWGTILGRAVVKTGNFFIVMLAARLVIGYANAPVEVTMTVHFLFTIAAVFQAAIWAREVILGAVEYKTASEQYHGEALGNAMGIIRLLVTFALFAIALIVVLDNLGVNVAGLIAGLGVGGIAIGLAAQGIFGDLFAALAIIFDRPFRRGDAITYDKSSGTVEAIGLKSTRIRAATGEERIISNKNLLDKEILNNSQRDYRRIQFTLSLAQWTPVETMEQLPAIIREIVEANGRKFIRCGFIAFGASSYDFDVEFDSPNAAFDDFFDARHSIGLAIIRRFDAEGIDLAYPTQTAFTATPGGGLVPPYPEAVAPDRKKPRTRGPAAPAAPTTPSGDRSAVDQDKPG
jgi:small-conductance mechanosensitive channel